MLTLQFGQCGNQVGHALFSNITSDLYSANTGISSKSNFNYVQSGFETWFEGLNKDGKHLARTVLVDTEQKVINKICNNDENNTTWAYNKKNIICKAEGGSANNWGFGFNVKGPRLKEGVLEAMRREIEKIDSFQGILAILSSAGGTGSGVGSHVMENIRDEFKTKTIASAVILPYASGEIATQNYNTLLTLAKLVDTTDLIFIFENDQIHRICESLFKLQNTNFNDLNRIIGHKLAAVLQPVFETTNILSILAHRIAPHPQYKIATIKTSPFTLPSVLNYDEGYKWQSILRHLKQMLRAPALDLELVDMETKMPSNSVPSRNTFVYTKSVSNVLITRGSAIDNDPIVATELNDKKLYVDWVPSRQQFLHLHQPRKILGKEKFSSLVTNNSQLHRPINEIVDKAWNNYIHTAFLHQYKKYGVSEDEFLQSFAKVENIVKVYKELNNEEIIS